MLACKRHHGCIVYTLRQSSQQVQSTLSRFYFKQPGQLMANCIDKDLLTFGVKGTHAANVPSKVALRHEICEHRLLDGRPMSLQQSTGRCESIHKVGWHNYISQPQRWEHHFTK